MNYEESKHRQEINLKNEELASAKFIYFVFGFAFGVVGTVLVFMYINA